MLVDYILGPGVCLSRGTAIRVAESLGEGRITMDIPALQPSASSDRFVSISNPNFEQELPGSCVIVTVSFLGAIRKTRFQMQQSGCQRAQLGE
jgi:hypothetical protein